MEGHAVFGLLATGAAETGGDMSLVTQLGVGGIFAILVIQMVLRFLEKTKDKKTDGSKSAAMTDLFAIARATKEASERLVEMHDCKDTDGVYVWYVPRRMERIIDDLGKNVAEFTSATKEMNKLLARLIEKASGG
jgi:hypothetical protein